MSLGSSTTTFETRPSGLKTTFAWPKLEAW